MQSWRGRKRMKLTFVGAAHEVTGSCHYIDACNKRMLVDYGMEQGRDLYENVPIPVSAAEIDYVFLTHAHIDHSGLLPMLFAKGFRGRIFATDATVGLSSIMLRDSAHIQMFEAEWRNRKAKRSSSVEPYEPLYRMEDADGAISLLSPVHYGEVLEVSEGISVRFTDVGHLLGSASVELWLTEEGQTKKIVFSGDIGNSDQPLLKDPTPVEEADYVLVESTYGDRLHSAEKVDYVAELAKVLNRTFARGGNVVIPAFAVGRTQELLYFLRKIKHDGLVEYKDFQVYVDSPLAVDATGVFTKNNLQCYDGEAMELIRQGIDPLDFDGLNLAITQEESRAINEDDEPKVIISASGMCEAGRIRHHLKHNLWRSESTVLFVGYQAEGTLGRSLVEGASEVRIFGESVEVRSEIDTVKGMSGHADQAGLLKWMGGFSKKKPEKVFVVHGEGEITDHFADLLKEKLGLEACAPFSGSVFDLLKNEFVYVAAPVAAEGRKGALRRISTVFEKLIAAGERLLAVIRKNEHGANKDLAKFTSQINSLCDKWDK